MLGNTTATPAPAGRATAYAHRSGVAAAGRTAPRGAAVGGGAADAAASSKSARAAAGRMVGEGGVWWEASGRAARGAQRARAAATRGVGPPRRLHLPPAPVLMLADVRPPAAPRPPWRPVGRAAAAARRPTGATGRRVNCAPDTPSRRAVGAAAPAQGVGRAAPGAAAAPERGVATPPPSGAAATPPPSLQRPPPPLPPRSAYDAVLGNVPVAAARRARPSRPPARPPRWALFVPRGWAPRAPPSPARKNDARPAPAARARARGGATALATLAASAASLAAFVASLGPGGRPRRAPAAEVQPPPRPAAPPPPRSPRSPRAVAALARLRDRCRPGALTGRRRAVV